jgi:hypothetical protein
VYVVISATEERVVPDKRPLGGNLVGLNGFSEQWTAICKSRLIAPKIQYLNQLSKQERAKLKLPDPPDLNSAPQGHFRAIVTIESGTAFVTIAKRALDYGYFNPSDFEGAVLEAELWPFGIEPRNLSELGRDRALNRIGMSITRLMKTFAFFGLFGPPVKTLHRLTDLGVKIYEELSETPDEEDPVAVNPGGGLQFMGRYSGIGTARGGYTQVTLHRYY